MTNMRGKVVVITGATSGIGSVAAETLAGMGARIVLVARDRARADAELVRLREKAPGLAHSVHYGDLSRLEEMKRVGREIAAAEARIDVLINNAGALFSHRTLTADGLELTFATNHMSYFVLTPLRTLTRARTSISPISNPRTTTPASGSTAGLSFVTFSIRVSSRAVWPAPG
jgi:NAD(P)-dependent dehydrogenase (short-subunit alcohol dehydrogenase family)